MQPLLDAVAAYLPSPADVPPVEGLEARRRKNAKLTRKPDADEPFCGLVFKIQADRHGDLHYLRVYSGQLKANSRVYNPGKDKKENVPQLWRIQADHREQVESVEAGDIIGLVGLRHSVTGDTLCDPAAADPAGIDHLPRNRDLHGHRAGNDHRAEEAGRRAGDDEAAGPHLPRPRKRRNRPDAHQRHGRAAPGGDQAPAAARLSPERAGAQAAGELPRDHRPGGRSDRRVPPQHGRPDAPGEARPSAWSPIRRAPSRS